MTLRKCPACKDIVGGECSLCPRCGVNFRNAQIHKVILCFVSATVLLGLGVLLFKAI